MTIDSTPDLARRALVSRFALAAGATLLAPSVATVAACGGSAATGVRTEGELASEAVREIPRALPANWDPIDYNRVRGNAGAIPASYLPSINGPDGPNVHLGKHLPYIPELDAEASAATVQGYLAIMWGDPAKEHTMHPNAVPNEGNGYEGHWYNWIRVRKATDGEAEELESTYPAWPGTTPEEDAKYAVFGGGALQDEGGKNTIYLAAIPDDCAPGELVRIHAHCLTHGEYVDFLRIPA